MATPIGTSGTDNIIGTNDADLIGAPQPFGVGPDVSYVVFGGDFGNALIS